jgi:putative ABC transport system ATP-binding protein
MNAPQPTAAEPVIIASGIRKAYRAGAISTPVLQGIEMEVRRGECVFLAGPSGSGKSTLLSILGCVLSADEGIVQILGQDVSRFRAKDQARFRRERIGFVFQRFHLFRGLRAWENVAVPMKLLGRKAGVKKDCYNLLESVGLAEKAANHVWQLSMGQRQRVALARALAGGPEILLADEPTASLDAESGHNAMRLIREMAGSRGKTVVVVTHDPRIFPMADRVLYLENGRISREISGSEASRAAGVSKTDAPALVAPG